MSVLWVGVATSVVMGAANMAAGKKRAKAQNEAMKEAAYVEGSAPIIPASNQLEIETIGDAPSGTEGSAPDFHEALESSYGDGIYDTQEFGSGPQQEIPPELEELLMMQQSSGQEPTNVQFASSGGPVGLPQDVYHFPVERINQMQMDVDPGVRNVGNAMMAQMEANPGMGMVGASAADIDQMAAGGPVRPKKYQDGSDGGLDIFAMLDQRAEDEGRLTGGDMEREYLLEMMNAPSEDPFSLENIQEQRRIKAAEEAAEHFLYSNQNWKINPPVDHKGHSLPPPKATGKEALELTDKGVLHKLLEQVGNIGSNFSKGIKLEHRFDEGPLERLLKERGVSYNFDKERKPFFGRKRQGGFERKKKEPLVLGPMGW